MLIWFCLDSRCSMFSVGRLRLLLSLMLLMVVMLIELKLVLCNVVSDRFEFWGVLLVVNLKWFSIVLV